MLSENTIKEWATKWQTSPLNVAREYLQHVFLSYLYQFPASDRLGFKGGTALRLLFKSPRFSEDLDFTGHLKPFHIEGLLKNTVEKVSDELTPLETLDSKPTSGGYLAVFQSVIHDMKVRVELNISLRGKTPFEPILATSPLHPAYQCLIVATEELVKEKCQALLTRKKPRDYFDLYFMMRERLGISAIVKLKRDLVKAASLLDSKTIAQELKIYLPISHHRVVANLKDVLLSELSRL